MKAIRILMYAITLLLYPTIRSYSQTVTQEWIVLPKPQGVNTISITENQLYVDDSLNVYTGGIFSDTSLIFNTSWGITKINPSGSVIWYAVVQGTGSSASKLKSIAVDSGYNVYASGDFPWGNGGVAQTNKYNAAGVLEWSRQLDTIGGLGTVAYGNLISTDNYCYEHISQQNITIRKFDAAGNVIQQFTNDTISFWLNNIFFATEFKRDYYNNLYVAGTYVSDTANLSESKYFVKKFNSLGVILWESFYNPTPGDDNPSGLFIDSLQNVYLTGTANNGSGFETVVYDSSGNEKWHQLFQSYNVGRADEIVADNAGNCYVSGVAPDSTVNGGFLLKYDTAGNKIWQHSIDSIYGYSFAKVRLDGMANIYVTYTGRPIPFTGIYIIVTAKYDSAGSLIWKVYYYSGQKVKALTLDKFNNVYIAGDGFIIKYSQTTGNDEQTNYPEQIKIYPNPLIDNQINFNLQFNNVSLSLYDCYGRLVLNKNNFNGSNLAIPDNLKSGLYVLEIVNEKILYNKKIIIH